MNANRDKEYFSEDADSAEHAPIYVNTSPGSPDLYPLVSEEAKEAELDQRRDLRDISSDGFSWGAANDGAEQLALAILADYFDDDIALEYYTEFAEQVITQYSGAVQFHLRAANLESFLGDDITNNSIGDVRINAFYKDSEAHTDGQTHYEYCEYLVVKGEELHVWVAGNHYLGAGTAYRVEEGDLFYDDTHPEWEPYVLEVTSIDESVSSSNPDVARKIIAPRGPETPSIPTQESSDTEPIHELSVDSLTGNYQPSMGDPGPPTLLIEPDKKADIDEDVVVTVLKDLGDGDPVEIDTLISTISEEYNTRGALVEPAIQQAISNQKCFINEDKLEPW